MKEKEMKTETAQRILWFAMVFIILMIIVTIFAALAAFAFIPLIDWVPIVTDPTLLAFLQEYAYVIPFALMFFAVLEIIYLAVIVYWRKDPLAHRTGLTIVGILNLLVGWSLPGFFIILPGLLMEEQ
ncbi:MAG: hypothetical protein ACFFAY_15140 [Promethearchaeota archaeon]